MNQIPALIRVFAYLSLLTVGRGMAGAVTGLVTVIIAAAVFAVLLRSRINPALPILGGALIGLFAFGPR